MITTYSHQVFIHKRDWEDAEKRDAMLDRVRETVVEAIVSQGREPTGWVLERTTFCRYDTEQGYVYATDAERADLVEFCHSAKATDGKDD